jgi:transglutaminase-like putative cysteine protease
MIIRTYIYLIITVLLLSSCGGDKKQTTNQINTNKDKFLVVKEVAKNREKELFDVFNENISKEESELLEYLYSYMPLSDLADYDGEFYLKHIRITLKSKNDMPWGKSIPESTFKHFVLPHRVNNENLDTARIVFFNELKDRIKGMSMYDAALEVNHWCHEHVEYHPADIRTSSPLATMQTAFGRCGEESTFAVAALRSVCIPARQVYTPRWAHSDDNHAWVEVCADGKWYFMGACEPLPALNMGWFSNAATRAMLVHARAYGEYKGNEEVNISTSQYEDINVTDRYANTFKQFIKVVDNKGNAIPKTTVEYQLYNYAEFYPITTKTTDNNGISYLTTGFGDLVIWCYNSDNYGFKQIRIGEKDTVTIVLSNPKFENTHWELFPPDASDKNSNNINDDVIARNKKKLQYEDSLRNIYVSSFIKEEEFIAKTHKNELWKYVKASRGNYNEIISFIESNSNSKWLEPMLKVIAEKDLRDTRAAILNSHLMNSIKYENKYSSDIFTKYILNPRVANEMMLDYSQYVSTKLSSSNSSATELINWIKQNIKINNKAQAYSLPITPKGVYNLRVSDSKSRDIFFVAACRSMGTPARLSAGTLIPQYYENNEWNDVYFDGKPKDYQKFGVSFKALEKDLKFTPQYFHHFTLARFENNRFNTLELGEYVDIDKIDDFQLRKGLYRLITSNRLSSGKILVDMKYLNLTKDTIIGLVFPKENKSEKILGTLNYSKLLTLIDGEKSKSCSLDKQSNTVVIIMQPDKEPSKHILNDIQLIKKDFEKTNSKIVFIIPKEDESATFSITNYPNLPSSSIFRTANNSPTRLLEIKLKTKETRQLPKVMIITPKGEIIYHSEGYKIGVGNEILKDI